MLQRVNSSPQNRQKLKIEIQNIATKNNMQPLGFVQQYEFKAMESFPV